MKPYGYVTMAKLDQLVTRAQELNDAYSKALDAGKDLPGVRDEVDQSLLCGVANYMVEHWSAIGAVTEELAHGEDAPYDGLDF